MNSSSSQFAGIGYRGQSQIVDEVMRSGNIPVAGPGKNGMMSGGGGLLPPALLDENRVPKFYKDAISACGATTPNLLPNTALVYNLMVTSGLPRPVLSYIWSAANRTLPGQLTRPEFFSCLALIALAQKGESLAALSTMDSLPIPHFSAVQLPAVQPQSQKQPSIPVLSPPSSMAQQQTQSRASAFIPSSLLMFKRSSNKQSKELIGDVVSPSNGSPTKSQKSSPTTSTAPSTSAANDLIGIDWGKPVTPTKEQEESPQMAASEQTKEECKNVDEATLECWRQAIGAVAELYAEAIAIFLNASDGALDELSQTEKGAIYFRCLDSAYQIARRIEQSAGEMTLKKDSRLADGLNRIEKAHRRFRKVIDEINEEEDCLNQQNSIYLGR
ncbi:hypothetical protein WR25_05568 isoform B [Diploscapter pachys]|nr:hypothetical protein WR25_05568 isoform B [Diploscapter pachys]